MKSSILFKAGIAGLVTSVLCCFTPILVILLGMIGLTAWVAYLDYLLMPALLFFLALTAFALTRKTND
ncbi:MAG: mercury resistance system transport protein MerF [Mariprofundaceae bacterium]|nr:mercury resistance system transport protein MerF [Mariprofundaceae bacterium]